MRAFALSLLLVTSVVAAQPAAWVATGGPVQTETYDLDQLPDGTVLLTGYGGGLPSPILFRLGADGAWLRVLEGESLSDVVPSETGALFALGSIVCLIRSEDPCFSDTLLRSEDRGTTWVPLVVGSETAVSDVAQGVPGVLYAGAEHGLYRSTDDGRAWTLVNANVRLPGSVRARADGVLFIASSHSLSRSYDGGATLEALVHPAPSSASLPYGRAPFEIGLDGSLYIWRTTTLFRSTDDGAAWAGTSPNASAIRSLDFDTDGALLLGTADGLLRSADGGATWTALGLAGVDVRGAARAPGGRLVVGTDNEALRQNGSAWTPFNAGLSAAGIQAFATDPLGRVLADARRGLVRTDDQGETWQELFPSGSSFGAFAVDPAGTIFLDAYRRSRDGGLTWEATSSTGYSIATLAAPAPDLVLAGSNSVQRRGVFRTTNGGDTWAQSGLMGRYVFDLAARSDGYVLAGTENGVYRSTNHGQSWGATSLTGIGIGAVAWGPGGIALAGGSNLYRSTDAGATWTRVQEGGGYKESLLFLPDGSRAFAGTREGVLVSNDLGLTWEPFSDGLPSGESSMRPLALDGEGYLYVGTDDAGVFRTAERIATASEPVPGVPPATAQLTLGPNPVRDRLRITVERPSAGAARLRVLDAHGRILAELAQRTFGAGMHVVEWDASTLAPGVYWVQLDEDTGARSIIRAFTRLR